MHFPRLWPRPPSLTDPERIHLYSTMISAYSARCRTEGSKVHYDVDVAWNQAWTGTTQMREYAVKGDTLTLTNHGVSAADGKKFTSTLTIKRER